MLLVVNVWTKSMSLVNTVEWLRSLSDLFVKCFCQLFWTGWCIIFNRRFMKSKNFHFQIEANFKTFLMKMSLHENRKKFSYRWLWTSPHFETDVWGKWKMTYRVFSHDVTAAILVSQNNETAAMLVSQTNPLGVEIFSYANTFFCFNKFA